MSTSSIKHSPLILVNNGTPCQENVCELHRANYTRNDPTIIECIAENGKSTRVSKVFHVDVHCEWPKAGSMENIVRCLDPPKIITNLRTFTGMRTIDVHLQCSSISNPPGSILWLDDQHLPIRDASIYTIRQSNQTSDLVFSVVNGRLFLLVELTYIFSRLISVAGGSADNRLLLSQ